MINNLKPPLLLQKVPKTVCGLLLLSLLLIMAIMHHQSPHTRRSLSDLGQMEKQKQKLMNNMTSFIEQYSQYSQLRLLMSNFAYGNATSDVAQQQEKEWHRLNDIYRLDALAWELPFCLIIQSLPWQDALAYELVLNSVFNQNYTNFRAIILHEPHQEGQFKIVQAYLRTHNIPEEKVVNILNTVPKGILKNIHDVSHQYCSPASISLNLVEGSQLLGRNVLRMFNSLYQINPVALIYSNFYRYSHGHYIKVGFNAKFKQEQLLDIRKQSFHISTAVTYRTDFILAIPEEELKDKQNKYLDDAYEQALFFPMVERMGGVILKIDGFHIVTRQKDANYTQFLERIRSKKNASVEIRQRKPHKINETYLQETKNSLIITSFSKEYLTTNPQLAEISAPTRQQDIGFQPRNPTPIFTLAADYLQTRAGDRYIYYSQLAVAQEKWNFELVRFDYMALIGAQNNNLMIKYNLFLGTDIDDQQHNLEEQEYRLINEIHQLSVYSQMELPFCIVVSEMPPKEEYFRFEYVLNSIFAQNYSNYFVVINNRNPMLDKYIRKYLRFYQIQKSKYAYRFNDDYTSSSLGAVHSSIHQHCSPKAIAIILTGREELLGRNVLQIFNAQYQKKNEEIIFAPTCFYDQKKREYGVIDPPEWTLKEIQENAYRTAERRFNFLITFKVPLFLAIDEKDFKDKSGKFYRTNLQQAIYFPLFELSCQKLRKIAGVYHIRNRDLDEGVRYLEQTKNELKKMPKYPCYKEKMASETAKQAAEIDSISDFRVQTGGIITAPSNKTTIDLLSFNQRGQKIQDYLYASADVIAQRSKYQQARKQAATAAEGDKYKNKKELTAFNLKLSREFDELEAKAMKEDQLMPIQTLNANNIELQQPICIVVDRLNFKPQFQYEYLLNSIFQQNYTNYFAVIFSDGSQHADSLLRKYLHFYQIPHENYVYIPQTNKTNALERVLYAAQRYCAKGGMVVYLRGEDELVGRNVLRRLSWAETRSHPLVITSDYLTYQEGKLQYYSTLDYADQYEEEKDLRKAVAMPRFAVFKTEHLLNKNTTYFKDEKGEYFKEAIERALFLPMIEAACSKVLKLDGANFLMRRQASLQEKSANELAEEQKINSKSAMDCPQQV